MMFYQHGVGYSKLGFNKVLDPQNFTAILETASASFLSNNLSTATLDQIFTILNTKSNYKNYVVNPKDYTSPEKGLQNAFDEFTDNDWENLKDFIEKPGTSKAESGKVLEGDIFALPGIPVITTNLGGVHGAGLAQAAKAKGLIVQGDGNFKATDTVVQLPVKKVWSDSMAMNNNMELLKQSLRSLIKTARENKDNTYLLPLAGLGHGEGSVQDILPLLIKTVQAEDNIKLVLPAADVNLGRQGTVRKDTTRENMPQIKAMLEEAGLLGGTTQPSTGVKPADFTNHSGGAYGGDTYWDIIGREFGVTNHKHYRDAGNTSLSAQLRKSGVQAEVLTKEQMDEARTEVERLLGEKYPDTLQGNLQVRNYYQVANSDAVFAIAEIGPSTQPVVFGGTNTAVQLGIKLGKPVYVFDLDTQKWYTQDKEYLDKGYNETKHAWDYNGWIEIDTPVLTKNFAGVGSRDIESYNVQKEGKWAPREQYKGKEVEEAAKQAIRDVYEKTFNQTTEPVITETIESLPTEAITDFYSELTEEQKNILGNLDELIEAYNDIPFNQPVEDYIEMLKCKL